MTFFLLAFIIIFICYVWMLLGISLMYDTVYARPPESVKQYTVLLTAVGPLGILIIMMIIAISVFFNCLGVFFNRLGVFFNCLGKLYGATFGAVASMIADKIRDYYNN